MSKAITKQYGNHPLVAYTDAARCPGKRASTSTVIVGQEHLRSASIRNDNLIVAEEVAIPLAIAQTTTLITDSQQACRNFSYGRIHRTFWQILQSDPHLPPRDE